MIRETYLRGWFTADVISSLPVGIIGVFLDSCASSGLGAVKGLRLLKLFKLLRLTRLKRLISRHTGGDNPNSMDLSPYLGLLITLFSIVFAAHVMACGWYFIGSDPDNGQPAYFEPPEDRRRRVLDGHIAAPQDGNGLGPGGGNASGNGRGTDDYDDHLLPIPGWVFRDPLWCDPLGTQPAAGNRVCHMEVSHGCSCSQDTHGQIPSC
eukprot:SAG22_NODE_879_length_6707_cov_14.725787_5_plen_208_part_00